MGGDRDDEKASFACVSFDQLFKQRCVVIQMFNDIQQEYDIVRAFEVPDIPGRPDPMPAEVFFDRGIDVQIHTVNACAREFFFDQFQEIAVAAADVKDAQRGFIRYFPREKLLDHARAGRFPGMANSIGSPFTEIHVSEASFF